MESVEVAYNRLKNRFCRKRDVMLQFLRKGADYYIQIEGQHTFANESYFKRSNLYKVLRAVNEGRIRGPKGEFLKVIDYTFGGYNRHRNPMTFIAFQIRTD